MKVEWKVYPTFNGVFFIFFRSKLRLAFDCEGQQKFWETGQRDETDDGCEAQDVIDLGIRYLRYPSIEGLLQCFYGDLGVSWGFYEGIAHSVASEEEEEKKKPAAKKKKEERKFNGVLHV